MTRIVSLIQQEALQVCLGGDHQKGQFKYGCRVLGLF
jgi:hypothetical protein